MPGSPHPGPDSAWYWPEAPTHADFYDGQGGLGGTGAPVWDVFSAPPVPFPYIDPGNIDRAKFGPPGTWWYYQLSDLEGRAPDFTVPNKLAQKIAKYVAGLFKKGIPSFGDGIWQTPGRISKDGEMPTSQGYRVGVHGIVAPGEEVINTFFMRPEGEVLATGPACSVLGDAVATAWANFLQGPLTYPNPQGSGTVRDAFAGVVWDEVTVAVVTYPALPAKPHYDVLTVHRPFPPGISSGNGAPLPTEVAMCLSLGTALRSKSGRGRTYLGPLSRNVMATGAGGFFDQAAAQAIAAHFWNLFLNDGPLRALATPRVLSQKLGDNNVITGVRVGVVPDSMRSRRNKLNEQYVLAGGIAAGI